MIFTVIFGLILTQAAFALFPRAEFAKPVNPVIRDCDRWDLLVVKFRENTGVRLRNGGFISRKNTDLSLLFQVLSEYPNTRYDRLFSRSETVYEEEKRTGELRTGRQLADLNLYYAFGPPDRQTAERLLIDLNKLDIVECAYPEPIPALPYVTTENRRLLPPSYVEYQDYLEASPIGVDVAAAWPEPGGKGENVQMIDVELAWRWTHIDLPEPFFQGGTPDPSVSYRNHGTAVLGIIAGIENEYGVTGIAPLTAVGGQAIDINAWPDNVGSYFDAASAALEPGDIWLIELHGPGPGGDYIAMEWWQANYDAIANSTALGRICVEAGGNGSANLDASIYEGKFDRTVRDSLAIMVGAGTPYDMIPEWFTNYGSRMDANGWGSGIYSTGYGDLYSSGGEDYYYTADFGGTSGASPMVVGVCCIAQSIYKELTGGNILDPLSLRTAITETGAPQPSPVTQYIGPRPNLAALLQHEIYDVEGVFMDYDIYPCNADINLLVRDPGASGSVTVLVHSTTEPAGETFVLNETDPGVFAAVAPLTDSASVPGDGYVSVSHGDTVTADYAPLSDTVSADIDCIAPVISAVTVSHVSDNSFTVTWTTDEPATSMVQYGETSPVVIVQDTSFQTEHAVTVEDLEGCTGYVFLVSSSDSAGNTAVDDNSGSYYPVTTWERILYLDEPMDTDPGWTYEQLWAWGQPTGQGGQYGNPDPDSGYTGNNVVGYNLNGDYPNNMSGTAWMTTDAFDCSGTSSVLLEFQCWLGVEQSIYDRAFLEVSNNNGGTWETIWENSTTLEGGEWELWAFDISDQAAGYSQVRIRWGMGPTDSAWQYCGWNIDDVQVFILQPCGEPTPTPTSTPVPTNTPTPTHTSPTPTPDCINNGDVNFDGVISAGDAQLAFQIALGQHTPTYEEECAADCNGNGVVSAGDAQQIFLAALGSGSCVDPL
jgi:serine protease